jgi:uncharacterized protein YkwD
MIKMRGLLVICAVMAVSAGAALACQKPAGASGIESEVIAWINAERAKKGLSKLKTNAALDKAAEAHACDIAKRGTLDHTGANGSNVKQRAKAKGYASGLIIENIFKSGKTSAAAPTAYWRKSAGHWTNIINPAIQDVGMAVATDGSSSYYVLVAADPR